MKSSSTLKIQQDTRSKIESYTTSLRSITYGAIYNTRSCIIHTVTHAPSGSKSNWHPLIKRSYRRHPPRPPFYRCLRHYENLKPRYISSCVSEISSIFPQRISRINFLKLEIPWIIEKPLPSGKWNENCTAKYFDWKYFDVFVHNERYVQCNKSSKESWNVGWKKSFIFIGSLA